jgi:uncharacterized protein (DUF302 family)
MAAGPAYALKKTVPLAITDAEAHVRKALADEGFGVLTEIDVTSTLEDMVPLAREVRHRMERVLAAL